MTMTDKQRIVYDYYRKFDREDKQPTYTQASKDLWLVPSVVYSHIIKLEKQGYLKRDSKGWIHIIEWWLDQKIIAIARDMRPWIKLPEFWKGRSEWIDLLRCAVLKKDEENSKIEQFINDKF